MYRKLISFLIIFLLIGGTTSAFTHAASLDLPASLPSLPANHSLKTQQHSSRLLTDQHLSTSLISSMNSSHTASNDSYDHVTLPNSSVNNNYSVSAVTYDVYNTTPDNAIFFNTGSSIQGHITSEGENRWYYTHVDKTNKLTTSLFLGSSTSIDYDLYLYKYNESTATLTQVSYSTKGGNLYEQLSYVAEKGYYFIQVQSYKGYDSVNPFTVVAGLSDSYDTNEPDDNPFFAKDRGSSTFSSNQTIDNLYDEDWTKIKITGNTGVRIALANSSAYGEYRLDLYDSNLTSLGYLNQNTTAQVPVPAGEYYIRVLAPSKFDLTTPYTLTVSYQTSEVARINISDITTDGGVYGYINYGSGQKWRIKSNISISGRAFDATGSPVANAIVSTQITVTINKKVFTANATTDSQGYFTIPVNSLSPAAGNYSYYNNGLSIHYYDIIPIQFFSGGRQINSDISSLYHFAYQIRA